MTKANLSTLRKLLLSPDYDQINHGIALFAEVNDPALTDKLHDVLNAKLLKGAQKRRHFVEHAIRGVLAFAPEGSATAEIRKEMRTVQFNCADTLEYTRKSIRHPADMSFLKHFELLESVEVRGAPEILGEAGLRTQSLFIGPIKKCDHYKRRIPDLGALSPDMELKELIVDCKSFDGSPRGGSLDLRRFPMSIERLDLSACACLKSVYPNNRIKGFEALPNLETLVAPG